MKRRLIFILLVVLLIFVCMGNVSGATHYVDPGDFLSVIASADSGDTVVFTDGLYPINDPIYILDSLKLVAQHYGGAVLRAESSVNSMIDVLVPGVTISGLVLDGNNRANDGIHGGFGGDNTQNGHFTYNIIRNCNNYGIFLNNSAYSVFSNNRVDGGRLGIAVLYSPLADLSNNRVTNVDCTGITVGESQLVTLTGNIVSGSGQDGILIRQSPYSRLENNNVYENTWNGIALDRSSNSLIMDNSARNNGGCGVYLYWTGLTSVLLNDLLYNGDGVVISGGKDNNLLGNNINFNEIGLQMWTNNNISYNNITNNTATGIYIGSNQNSVDTSRIFNNTLLWNLNGILISGSGNDINPDLLADNWVFENSYMLTVQGNENLLNETLLYGNTNGLRIIGNENILTNITAAYNSLTGIIVNGIGNTLENSLILNNTNGISITGNTNTINSILILNTTDGLTLNGIQNFINGTEILNGTNGMIIAGKGNNITNNNVYNNNNNGIYISGDNLVTGNYITYNNGTGLVIQTDNNNVNLTNTLWNIIFNNGGGITLMGDGNDIGNVLMLFNILLNNDYALTITGNNNKLNNTIFTLNSNGLQVNGDNNSFKNITARNNNVNGIIVNGNNNSINSSSITNNTNGITVNGNQNTVNGTQINNNTNGILINGSQNALNQSNIHNNSQNAVILDGDNNILLQNNITGSNEAIVVENGTNNTINYNRIARHNHNIMNKGNGTLNASYNWWGQNNPNGITGANIDISNHVVAILNIQNVNNGIIVPGTIYNVTLTLRSADGQELALEIPSFLVQFSFDGDIYPEQTAVVNNTAETQLQVFNPGSYTLKVLADQQTLTKTLSTPVNSQPAMNRVSLKPKATGAYKMSSLGIVSLGLKISASSVVTPPDGMSSEESVKWKFQYYSSLSDSEKLQFLQNPIIPKFTNDEKEYISKYFNENYNDFKDKKTEAAAAAVAISSLAGLAFFIVLSGGTSLIPFAGGTIETAVVETGAAEATAAATAAAEAATGTGIIATLIELLPLALRPIAREIIGRGIQYGYTALNWILESFSVYSLDSLGIGQSLIEVIGPRLPGPLGRAISSVIRNPFYVQQSINYNLLGLTDYFSKPPESRQNIVDQGFKPFYNNYIKPTFDMIYNNNVKPVFDRFNKEVKEFKQKSTVNYIKSKVISSINKKVTQAKKIYHSIEKSYNDFKRSNAPIRTTLHKHLDSIVKNKKYQTFRNSHFIKQVVDAMSWGARVLGLW